MQLLNYFVFLPVILWVGLYTFNFGRWCLKQKNIVGAIFVFLLASASVVVPGYLLFFKPMG